MDTLKKRRFEFIDEDVYKVLDKSMKKKLTDYREQYRVCILKEKRINTLKSKLKEQQDLLRVMKRELTELSNPLEHLKDKWEYYPSITSYKKGNHWYYNLCISGVVKNNSKSIGLGREDTDRGIVKHLLKYYKTDKKNIREIKKDWKQFIKDELNLTGSSVRNRLMNTIKINPIGFKNLTLNRNTLFPLS